MCVCMCLCISVCVCVCVSMYVCVCMSQQLQDQDERRVNKIQELVKSCADVERNILPIVNTCIDGIVKASLMVHANEVITIHQYNTSIPITIG